MGVRVVKGDGILGLYNGLSASVLRQVGLFSAILGKVVQYKVTLVSNWQVLGNSSDDICLIAWCCACLCVCVRACVCVFAYVHVLFYFHYNRGRSYTKKTAFFMQKKSRLRKSENAMRLLYAKNSDLTHQNAFSLFVFCT